MVLPLRSLELSAIRRAFRRTEEKENPRSPSGKYRNPRNTFTVLKRGGVRDRWKKAEWALEASGERGLRRKKQKATDKKLRKGKQSMQSVEMRMGFHIFLR